MSRLIQKYRSSRNSLETVTRQQEELAQKRDQILVRKLEEMKQLKEYEARIKNALDKIRRLQEKVSSSQEEVDILTGVIGELRNTKNLIISDMKEYNSSVFRKEVFWVDSAEDMRLLHSLKMESLGDFNPRYIVDMNKLPDFETRSEIVKQAEILSIPMYVTGCAK